MTALINSACHMFGIQPYETENSARDSWWLAFFSNGEGYHNFHHRFPSDYRNGHRWFHWDPTKWAIKSMSFVGLTRNLKRATDDAVAGARRKVSEHFLMTSASKR
jgi:stearoyl-CoA desaturase (delta-9 desaturase)